MAPSTHHRRSLRLQSYNYALPGAYFVTLVSHQRQCLFGNIIAEQINLTYAGECAAAGLQNLASHFPLQLDVWMVMPNHIHFIVLIEAADTLPLPPQIDNPPLDRPHGTQPASLGAIVQNYKSITTRRIHALGNIPSAPVWQRNYYEHIIRTDADMRAIQQYIQDHPQRWQDDKYYLP